MRAPAASRLAAFGAVVCLAAACATFPGMQKSITEVAPEGFSPLVPPHQTMKGGKGDADAPYPADFGAVVKPDGTIAFPQHTPGKIQGNTLLVGGEPVLTVDDDGNIKGVALKHHYKFVSDGSLLDEDFHGVRIAPDGTVRGVGGTWSYRSVFAWTPDSGTWDMTGWRTLELVALVVVENMLPTAIREPDAGPGDGGPKRFEIHIPPPSQWFK